MSIENWLGIKELVLMSIGTDKGRWWADKEFGSELWILRQQGKVDGRTAGILRRMVLDCLQWLKEDGLAEKIECSAERVGKDKIEYIVTVHQPNGGKALVKEVWNGI